MYKDKKTEDLSDAEDVEERIKATKGNVGGSRCLGLRSRSLDPFYRQEP